ncbi:hypothetical protein EYC84_001977 [Monilinia fructicola]|uniref:Heterokaryon incompatibility domain-containing protein n=1 Tax=Monilinia fructicola TaxID=38448 RepID=A0A5M9JS13_MONFR|nr:hypothetical protein EYC84_001977 [Monilinia fructicola]
MHPDREEYERVAHIEIYTPVSAPQNLIQHGNDVLSTFDMVDAVSIARRWLHSCLNYHSNNPFRPHRGIFQLPNRVLDVSLSKTGLLRLVDKTQVDLLYGGLNTEYATLSHCWGSEQNVQSTTRANFIERMQCFEMKELSRTLQEAILFTLALGINYLWVDCLCIIQDSRGDWEYESSRMHGIYRLSYLNISAVSGENGSSGLFNPRWAPEVSAPARRSPVESLEVGEFEVPSETFACKINLKIMVRFSLSRAHEDITNPSEMQGIDPVSPLLTRGWAFQERIFSLRTISFHAAELTWDCQHEIKCECGTSGSVDHTEQATNFTKQYIGKFYEARDRWGADFIEQSEEDWEGGITNPWHEIVSQFSTLKLTMASDRLPALSGMAQYFDAYMKSGVRGTQYLAGLWRDSLVKDLCWYVQVSENHCAPARAKPYRAPTWSWASVDLKDDQYSASPILYQPDMSSKFEQSTRLIVRHMETTLAGKDDVRHGETHHATRDYHGAVSGGLLRIRCILIEANVVLHPRRDREHVRRHTVQFSERDPLDQHCPPEFLPNLYLDISFMEPTQKSLADDPVSSDAMALDMTFDTTSLTKEGSMDQDGSTWRAVRWLEQQLYATGRERERNRHRDTLTRSIDAGTYGPKIGCQTVQFK